MTYSTVMKKYLTIFFVFYLIAPGESGFFSSSIDKLKKKAKLAYSKKFGKGYVTVYLGKSLNFWGYEQSEYPGANNKFREENRAKWDEYYTCLNRQKENLEKQKTVMPEAILGFEGSYVNMECKICLSPLESQNKESIVWNFGAPEADTTSPIEYTEHIVVSPEDKSLHIYNLNWENTGQYICNLGESATAPYFVTVFNASDSVLSEVHNPTAPVGPYPKESEEIDYNLVLDTEWGEWSTCSKCNDVGRKYKLGYCSVYSKNLRNVESAGSTNPANRTKKSEDEIQDLFTVFKYGIPCQSHILPDVLKKLPQVIDRRNEIMTGYCNVKCPENKVFEVRDKQGKVIETANNSEGIYALSQGIPPMEPPTERRLQYEAKGKNIILECPGNINSDAPIQWQIGDKNLIPEIISKESNGRIYISISDKIHVNKAKISDSNIYSCWQLKELAGTIRLVVEKKFELNFNHTIMLFGLVIILGTFLYVFVKIIATRQSIKGSS